MNASSAIPVACGTALALMVGAVISHELTVRQTVALASHLQPTPPLPSSPIPLPTPTPHNSPAPSLEKPAVATTRDVPPSAIDRRIEQLLGIIETNHAQITDLKNQLAETNRDIMEMQFQLDSHSQQFRPLQINNENSEDYTPSILPPDQSQ